MIIYEWDVETLDDFGDIENHEHSETLLPHCLDLGPNDRLVLVRDHYSDDGGLDRSWAYVKNFRLPLYFEDAYGQKVKRVPQHFQLSMDALVKEMLNEQYR